MLEKQLFDELHKRIEHRFKLSGRPYSKRSHGKYFRMLLREIVDKILDDVIDPVKEQKSWWCNSCHEFIPVREVAQDSYYHYDCGGNYHYDCGGDCRLFNKKGGN